MKKIFLMILIAGQSLLAQEQWYSCLHSYSSASSPLIDIRYGTVSSHNYMIFRNGNHFNQEELNIYYKGKFWKAALQLTDDFYKKKFLQVSLGEDRLCLKRDFRWILTDRSELTAFNQSECGSLETITMRENSSSLHPTSQEVLAYKLERDVKFQADCVAGRAAGGCTPESRREDFERLSQWNTEACSQIETSSIQSTLNLFTESVQIFNSTVANSTAPE